MCLIFSGLAFFSVGQVFELFLCQLEPEARGSFRSHAGRWIFNTIRTCLWLRSWRGIELFPDHQEHVLKLRGIFLLCLNPQPFLVCHNSHCYFTSVEIISNHLNSVSLCCLFFQKQFENVWAEHELTII